MKSNIDIVKINKAVYPKENLYFRPSAAYPEYLYSDDISTEINYVYEGVRECFHMHGYDRNNYGKKEWNPLSTLIKKGDIVLIKPNLVMDENKVGGVECLYTQPAVVAAVIDYVLIALDKTGKVIIGDAPMQECNFKNLIEKSGYKRLVGYYQQKGVDIELLDFRNVKTVVNDGVRILQEEEKNDGVIVRLEDESAFCGLNKERINKLRITNYDPRLLLKHHNENYHEYNIAKEILNADVVINVPKPKTHRKAGVTIALKNMVGMNANKEFLPHHTLGSVGEGGDAYPVENHYYRYANEILDIRNVFVREGKNEIVKLAEQLYEKIKELGGNNDKNGYWEGSWFGNDTIWRTILDLNYILFFADRNGKIKKNVQRKYLIVADLVISGQKDGPLQPEPMEAGVIAVGENPILFDRAICSLMGFDYKMIPSIYNENDSFLSDIFGNDYEIHSNVLSWDGKKIEELKNYSLNYQPSSGWEEKLGNPYKLHLLQNLKDNNENIIIWGAGPVGKRAVHSLAREGITIEKVFDNDNKKWDTEIGVGVKCYKPEAVLEGKRIILAVNPKYINEIKKQVEKLGGIIIGVWN